MLSIGALAGATGISTHALRVWERRYGVPQAIRLPSGHRRYPSELVPHLRLAAEALRRGRPARRVLPLGVEALRESLGSDASVRLGVHAESADWLMAVRTGAVDRLRDRFAATLERVGLIGFLEEWAGPFLHEIGSAWAAGELQIRHERTASALVEELLASVPRAPARESVAQSQIVVASLPDDHHALALSMVDAVIRSRGAASLRLGCDLPLDQLLAAAHEGSVRAVAVSVSLARAGAVADRMLRTLRGSLNPRIPLILGGAGALGMRRCPSGVILCPSLARFAAWLDAPETLARV